MTKHLELVKHIFGTQKYNTSQGNWRCERKRVHIVVGFIPWFEKDGDDWKPNKYFGIQPIDMIRSKMIFPCTMKIFAVRIGDKYGPEYETYLEKNFQIMRWFGCNI